MRKDKLQDRHIGIRKADEQEMLDAIGVKSLDELIDKVMPKDIRLPEPLKLGKAMTEREYAEHISKLAAKNNIYSATYLKIRYGTHHIHRIRQKYHREDLKP